MTTAQRLQRIAEIFTEVNQTYFHGVIPEPDFDLSTRLTSTAGQVWLGRWLMVISIPYHDAHGWADELVDTVKHEAVHLYLARLLRPWGHTREFKAICQGIGASLHCKAMPRRRPHYRYLVHCDHCGQQWYRGSWQRRLACRECCRVYNHGRYTAQFQLTLIKRLRSESQTALVQAPGPAESQLILFGEGS